MKNNLIRVCICGICLLCLTGCTTNEPQEKKENFPLGTTLDDGRHVTFTFDVPYNEGSLSDALLHNEITIDELVNKLELIDTLKDGGSKLYQYNKMNQEFGNKNFYVMVCNSLEGVNDIFVAQYKENLTDKCTIKINDLEGVSMEIKDGTLTKSGAVIVITDTSDRKNIYGSPYRLDEYKNGKWVKLEPKEDMVFTSIGYAVDETNKLELKINWESFYGKLKSGKYRIVKSTSEALEGTSHYITAEFTIE